MSAGNFSELELAFQIGAMIVPNKVIRSFQVDQSEIREHIHKYKELLSFVDKLPENQRATARSQSELQQLAMSYLRPDFLGLLPGNTLSFKRIHTTEINR